ncbi:hypothetical protein [Goodfellowiella coeruleoviolacea]|uniref:Uncharacterized protein n=1 Tax=Goodfellowiella coeruleoviolacea TaxID=334858 RepID=A0AAE3GCQ5_9PSEU|nr:hypothetical protein [Goodfellowiella coeruleoviolacea]MCP2164847.1 hypothetical protein [Goodfellowiella coeruleoviolacea]
MADEQEPDDEVEDDGKRSIIDDKQTPLTGETLDPSTFEPESK